MEISGRCMLDETTSRALQGLILFGKKDPRRAFRRRMILYAVLSALLILLGIPMRGEPLFPIYPIVAVLCLGGIFLTTYVYHIQPKRMQKKSPLAGVENLYVFHEDALTVTTHGPNGFFAEETRPYSMLIKLAETTQYFFLFLDKTHVYPIDKNSMSEPELAEVRRRICAVPSIRYQLCHY